MPNDNDDDDCPRRQEHDRDWDRGDRDDNRRPQSAGNGLATAGLILGALSLFTLCLTGIPAVICSLAALGKSAGRGKAVAGLLLGSLGTLGGIGAGWWAFTQVSLVRMRMADSNNMYHIGLALCNQREMRGKFAAPYAVDELGHVHQGLSWRVGLLPYIQQYDLYRRFDLEQSWDSAANQSVSNTPIGTYASPYDGRKPSARTPYRVFCGGGALFEEDGSPVSIWAITDGSSNTIMAVHAFEQVPWAEPKELKYDPNGPLPKLGHPEMSRGFQVLMADGAVRFISKDVSEKTLRAAITKSGGELLGADW